MRIKEASDGRFNTGKVQWESLLKYAKHWGYSFSEDSGNFFNGYCYHPCTTLSVNTMIKMHNQGVGSPSKLRYGTYTTSNYDTRMKSLQRDRIVKQVKAQWCKKTRTFIVQSSKVVFFDRSIADLIGNAEDTIKNLIVELDAGKPF